MVSAGEGGVTLLVSNSQLIEVLDKQAIREFSPIYREIFASFRKLFTTFDAVRKRFGRVRNGAKGCENDAKHCENDGHSTKNTFWETITWETFRLELFARTIFRYLYKRNLEVDFFHFLDRPQHQFMKSVRFR